MFDQTFVDTQACNRRPWTVAASVTFQTAILAAALLAPILRPDILPLGGLRANREFPVFMRLQAIPLPPAAAMPQTRAPRLRIETFPFTIPTASPKRIDTVGEAPEVLDFRATGPDGAAAPFDEIALPAFPAARPSTPGAPPAPPPDIPRGPIEVGTGVQAARLVFGPRPLYPPLARSAHVQGTVRMEAIVSFDGSIQNLKIVSGPPLLTAAAIEAVRRWRYRPTTLNGRPVEVITEIDVNFTLSQ